MIKKFKDYIIRDFKTNYKFYIGLVLILLLFFIKFDYYIFSPGKTIDLTDRIIVDNSNTVKGSFNLTYVTARNGNIPNIILSKIIPSWNLVDLDSVRIEDESEKDIVERDKVYLKETSYDAIIAAFKAANREYKIKSIDLTVTHVYNLSNTNLKTGDIIKKVDNKEVKSVKEINDIISSHKENDKVTI